jgi:hypothetical protein
MMFNQSPLETEPQVCNNFARKSIRGFFHDFMSNGIDGSILSEHDIGHNFGLCRWAQYINVLSDHTKCDPGSIIAMAGMLGYKACGVDVWNLDVAVIPFVEIGRKYECKSKLDTQLFDQHTRQRQHRFSDTQLSANATAMEEFWYDKMRILKKLLFFLRLHVSFHYFVLYLSRYVTNSHFARGDGEVEYSAEAGAAAHAIGRVTCRPDGVDLNGESVDHSLGFFHEKRDESRDYTESEFYQEAIGKMRDTQCDESTGDPTPTVRAIFHKFEFSFHYVKVV